MHACGPQSPKLSTLSHSPVLCCEGKSLLGILLFWLKIHVSVPGMIRQCRYQFCLCRQVCCCCYMVIRLSDAPDARDAVSNVLAGCKHNRIAWPMIGVLMLGLAFPLTSYSERGTVYSNSILHSLADKSRNQ